MGLLATAGIAWGLKKLFGSAKPTKTERISPRIASRISPKSFARKLVANNTDILAYTPFLEELTYGEKRNFARAVAMELEEEFEKDPNRKEEIRRRIKKNGY